jgi:hypothetical protein
MRKIRIGIDGKLFGCIACHWSASKSITSSEAPYVLWLGDWLNGMDVKIGSVLRGKWFVEVVGAP